MKNILKKTTGIFFLSSIFCSSCSPPPSTGNTSFSSAMVRVNVGLAAVLFSEYKEIDSSSMRFYSEDNVSFTLDFLSCRMFVSNSGIENLNVESPLSEIEVALALSNFSDNWNFFSGDSQVEDTYIGFLRDPTQIRIAESWPISGLPCSNDYITAILIRKSKKIDEEIERHELDGDQYVMIRLVSIKKETIPAWVQYIEMDRNGEPPSKFPGEIMIHDGLLLRDSLTPAQENELGSVAADVAAGLARALAKKI